MPEEQISFQKTIAFSFSSIFHAKIRNFKKKSLVKYAFSSVILSAGIILNRGGNPLSKSGLLLCLNLFLLLSIFSLFCIYTSSLFMARKLAHKRMIYTFSRRGIHIVNQINGMEEEHDWSWIRSRELTKKAFYLKVRSKRPYEIILDLKKITDTELELLKKWLGDPS